MPNCSLCGEPMPEGEEMFMYHGYSGNCPKPPLPKEFPLRDKCEAKAKKFDMPHFTLIACDNHATKTVFFWLEHARGTGMPEDKIKETEAILVAMQKWRDEHPDLCKNPD